MKKKKVRLGLSEKTLLEKIDLGNNIVVTNCTGNLKFPAPSPDLIEITNACDNAKTAHDLALGGGVALTAAMHVSEAILDSLLTAIGGYIDSVAQGDELVILSAGVEASKNPEHPGPMGQVTGLEAKPAPMPGEIKIHFNKLKPAICYLLYRALTAEGAYEQVTILSSTRYIDKGLQSLHSFWYKVQAIGRGGRIGPFSDPAMGVAM